MTRAFVAAAAALLVACGASSPVGPAMPPGESITHAPTPEGDRG